MQSAPQHWIWPDGKPFDVQRCLFAPAPPQIGKVVVASSTLSQNRVWLRAFSSLGMQFRHTLGYVGDRGLACFECGREPSHLTRNEVVVFPEAASLFVRINGDGFEFLWKDPLDRLLFRYEDVMPRSMGSDHIYHLLRAGEGVWTEWLLESACDQVARGGSVNFQVLGQGNLRVSQNGLALGSVEWSRDDVESVRDDPTGIEIRPSYQAEARGLRPIRATKGCIGNAEALLKLISRALGIPVKA